MTAVMAADTLNLRRVRARASARGLAPRGALVYGSDHFLQAAAYHFGGIALPHQPPPGFRQPLPQLGIGIQACHRIGELLRFIGNQYVAPMLEIHAFGGDGRRHHRQAIAEARAQLALDARAEAQRGHDHTAVVEVWGDVLLETEYPDVIAGQGLDLRWRARADHQEPRVGNAAPEHRQYLTCEIKYRLD